MENFFSESDFQNNEFYNFSQQNLHFAIALRTLCKSRCNLSALDKYWSFLVRSRDGNECRVFLTFFDPCSLRLSWEGWIIEAVSSWAGNVQKHSIIVQICSRALADSLKPAGHQKSWRHTREQKTSDGRGRANNKGEKGHERKSI